MWLVLLACQVPFGADRHDLVGFRVVAVSVPPASAGQVVVPEVALVVDGRPWADEPVELAWYWVAEPEDVAALDPVAALDGYGPAAALTVPEDGATLGLLARHGEAEERAFVTLAAPPSSLTGAFTVAAESLPLNVEDVDGGELLLDARAALTPGPLAELAPGDFVRLTAEVDGDPLVRWTATRGTLFELARDVADWAAGELQLDDDEIAEGRSLAEAGPVTVVALALGPPGEVRFAARDLVVGEPGDAVLVSGRIVPVEPAVSAADGAGVSGRIVADDAAPSGIRLVDARAVDPDGVPPGTSALPCAAPLEGPFDPRVLLNGICTRSAIEGFEVVVVPDSPW